MVTSFITTLDGQLLSAASRRAAGGSAEVPAEILSERFTLQPEVLHRLRDDSDQLRIILCHERSDRNELASELQFALAEVPGRESITLNLEELEAGSERQDASFADVIARSVLEGHDVILDESCLRLLSQFSLAVVGPSIRTLPNAASTLSPPRNAGWPLDRTFALRKLDALDVLLAHATNNEPSVILDRARANGVEGLVVLQPSLRRSALADLLLRNVTRETSIRPYLAMADLFRRRSNEANIDRAILDEANELESKVAKWVDQRIWSLNLAPELVAHDDRHVERVDYLATQMGGVLLEREIKDVDGRATQYVLEPYDLTLLSFASWLHDWGHVGGRLGEELVDHPSDVRHLHGMITRELLLSGNESVHGLTDERTRRVVGSLSAHHQGWTSFGDEDADMHSDEWKTCERLLYRPTTLVQELDGIYPQEKAQLLLAILRVADGADLGRHRVPNLDALSGALPPETHFLRQCIRKQAMRLLRRLHDQGCDEVETVRIISRISVDQMPHERIEDLRNIRHPLVEEFRDYINFVKKQSVHYARHREVESVSMRVLQHGDRWGYGAYVVPHQSAVPASAAVNVARSIQKELDRPGGSATVRRLLEANGLVFEGAFVALAAK